MDYNPLTIEEYHFLTFNPEILGYTNKLNLWKMKPNENRCQYVISENVCDCYIQCKDIKLCNEKTYACIYLANESYFTLNKWKIIYLCKSHIIMQCKNIWKNQSIPIRNPPYFGLFHISIDLLKTFLKNDELNKLWDYNEDMWEELHPKIAPLPGPDGKELRRKITQGIKKRAYYIDKLIPKEQFYIKDILPCNFI